MITWLISCTISSIGFPFMSIPWLPPSIQCTSWLRDEPLYEIRKPILFVSGTDDDMCKQELFLPVLDQLTSHDVHWIEGGNHGMDIKGKRKQRQLILIPLTDL
jgi:predicted alpha/beta-hydrolase family hydrolase